MSRALISNASGSLLFFVAENKVYNVAPNGDRTVIGTLLTHSGSVGFKIGLNQLVIVDGSFGYVYDLNTKVFSRITSEAFLGSYTVEQIGGYFSFIKPNSQTFYISSSEDASTIDALDFATANHSPDKLVGQVVTNNVIVYFGEDGAEIWQINPSPSLTDLAIERNNGAYIEVGLMAPFSLQSMDNSVFWLGKDARGAGIVYHMQGFSPLRVSTNALEEQITAAIQAGNDVSKAVAYTYQQSGHSFYVIQIPGVPLTWAYDAATQAWHERCDFKLGEKIHHRGSYHAYAFGRHLLAAADNKIYELDPKANTNAGDLLLRERTSPHYATPGLDRVRFNLFELDCVVGYGVAGQKPATVQLQYSDDGGFTWSEWRDGSLGGVGEKQTRVRWLRCGSARDRIWRTRCTDDVPFAIINAVVESA